MPGTSLVTRSHISEAEIEHAADVFNGRARA